ncbi:hypothetical protein Cgig2_026602 [Carnegiea gigantea]|uniref:Uncharacterized protein n=1 Tax=Carnegiea gigantea TaxID=171969 RepID=A0A9Q1KJB0_9CARY|nr:hypothetical protein Cgig2_026602 [Carnegiea gigantea]
MGANGVYLVSLVKSMPISLVLKTILGLKFTNTATPTLTRKVAKDLCLTRYACPQKNENLQMPKQNTTLSCLLFRASLASLYYTLIIVSYIYRVANMSRPFHLPYGNLLTRIFTYSKVPLDPKDCVNQTIPVISAHSFKTLRFYKAATGGWRHVFELTSDEATTLMVPLPDHPSLTTLMDNLESLRANHTEFRNKVDLMHFEMGLVSRKLDELMCMTSLV